MDMAVPHLHHEDSSPVPILQVTRHLRCHGRRDQSDPLPNTHSRLGHFPGPWREGFDNTPPSSNNTAALSTSSGSTKQRHHHWAVAGRCSGAHRRDDVPRSGQRRCFSVAGGRPDVYHHVIQIEAAGGVLDTSRSNVPNASGERLAALVLHPLPDRNSAPRAWLLAHPIETHSTGERSVGK